VPILVRHRDMISGCQDDFQRKNGRIPTHMMNPIWLWLTVSHEKSPFLIGKPSISMGHLYHGYVSHNQRVVAFITTHDWEWSIVTIPPIRMVMTGGWLIIILTTWHGIPWPLSMGCFCPAHTQKPPDSWSFSECWGSNQD
jgi:hypothetical protein